MMQIIEFIGKRYGTGLELHSGKGNHRKMTVPDRQPRLAVFKSTFISVPLSGNNQAYIGLGDLSRLSTRNGHCGDRIMMGGW